MWEYLTLPSLKIRLPVTRLNTEELKTATLLEHT
jgi:hypothetical protein